MYFMEHMVAFKYMDPTCGDPIGAIAIFPLSHFFVQRELRLRRKG